MIRIALINEYIGYTTILDVQIKTFSVTKLQQAIYTHIVIEVVVILLGWSTAYSQFSDLRVQWFSFN
jgi:hypothetical protein